MRVTCNEKADDRGGFVVELHDEGRGNLWRTEIDQNGTWRAEQRKLLEGGESEHVQDLGEGQMTAQLPMPSEVTDIRQVLDPWHREMAAHVPSMQRMMWEFSHQLRMDAPHSMQLC